MMLPGLAPERPHVAASGDDWYTPQWLLDWLPPIALDPCYSAASFVRAASTLDLRRGDDGLADAWEPVGDGIVFCNPPFSNCAAWLRRCRVQAAKLDRVVVALVPAIPGDGPWHAEVWPHAPLVGFIAGRVGFADPAGRVESKGRGHALVLYGHPAEVREVAQFIADRARHHEQAPVWVGRAVEVR